MGKFSILIAEDDADDRFLMQTALNETRSEEKIKFVDPKRELDLIHMFDQKTKSDSDLKKMIQKIQKTILTENKKYLKKRAERYTDAKI